MLESEDLELLKTPNRSPPASSLSQDCLHHIESMTFFICTSASQFQVVLDELLPKLVFPSEMIYNSIVDTNYAIGHRIGKGAFITYPNWPG